MVALDDVVAILERGRYGQSIVLQVAEDIHRGVNAILVLNLYAEIGLRSFALHLYIKGVESGAGGVFGDLIGSEHRRGGAIDGDAV